MSRYFIIFGLLAFFPFNISAQPRGYKNSAEVQAETEAVFDVQRCYSGYETLVKICDIQYTHGTVSYDNCLQQAIDVFELCYDKETGNIR